MGKGKIFIFWAGLLATGILSSASPTLWGATKRHSVNLWSGTEVTCSGTVIALRSSPPQRLLLTAGHCVESTSGPFFISQGSSPEVLWRAKYVDHLFAGIEEWRLGDWALFEIPPAFPEAGAYVCEGIPEPGEEVWAWSGPDGMAPVLLVGRYAGEIHFPNGGESERSLGGMHLVDIAALPGSSGSGVFRVEAGSPCVWGILVGIFAKGRGAIVAPTPERIRPEKTPKAARKVQ